jgi:hypothetical protein
MQQATAITISITLWVWPSLLLYYCIGCVDGH